MEYTPAAVNVGAIEQLAELSTHEPSEVLPLKNSMEPVANEGVMVAVSVTAWPTYELAELLATDTAETAFVIVPFAGTVLTM